MAFAKYLHEIFEDIGDSEDRAEAANKLLEYNKTLGPRDSLAMRDVIKGALDPMIVWRLPTSRPPFRACQEYNMPSNVFKETPKFKYLIDGTPYSVDSAKKRDNIFIGILEVIHPKDAEVLIGMVQKKLDYKHLTPTTVRQAFGNNFFEEDRAAQAARVRGKAVRA